MFFSTAKALNIPRSASCHVTTRLSGAMFLTALVTSSKAAWSAGEAVFTWIAYTPRSSAISSRTLYSEATAYPES